MKLNNCGLLCALTLLATPFLTTQSATAQTAKTQTAVAGKRSAKTASWIALNVRADKTRYATGEPIKVELNATNIQSKDAYLKFSSGQRFDLQLFEGSSKEPVYTWSADKMFAAAISHVKLKRGQSENYEATIGSEMGALKPGKYRLQAHLANSSQIGAAPLEFTVVAGATADKADATLTATTDKRIYNAGEPVEVTFALKNNANEPLTFNFNSGQTYDLLVFNMAGEQVWNWAANKRFAMALREVTLAAGETQKFSAQWDGRTLMDSKIASGKYTVQAVYVSNPEIRSEPVSIEIKRVGGPTD